MKEYRILERTTPISNNFQTVYRFPNNYGASVVTGEFTYGGNLGLFELGVIKFKDDDNDSWDLNYKTEITDDVIGNLTPHEVDELLIKIKNLKGEVSE